MDTRLIFRDSRLVLKVRGRLGIRTRSSGWRAPYGALRVDPRAQKSLAGANSDPYRKPTQVGELSRLRRAREPS